MPANKSWLEAILQPLVAVIIGLLAGAIAIRLTGAPVLGTYTQMWDGAFGNFYFFTRTLTRATPIILTGLGVALAFRAGFFNLGAEGQMVFGAVAAALTALYLPGPGLVKLVAALVAGFLAGGLWSVLAGWMDVRFKVNIVISTLLLNYIADLFAHYLVNGPFKDHSGAGALAQTAMIAPAARLPQLFARSDLHAGFIIALLAAVVLYVVLRKSVLGYELRMFGYNPFFAAYGGIRRARMMFTSMLISGGLAGLGGAVQVLGLQYRYIAGSLVTPQYAWTGLMAALLANSHPLGTTVAAFGLAALQMGGAGVELNTNVPMQIASLIQDIIIVLVTVRFAYGWLARRGQSQPEAGPGDQGPAVAGGGE